MFDLNYQKILYCNKTKNTVESYARKKSTLSLNNKKSQITRKKLLVFKEQVLLTVKLM